MAASSKPTDEKTDLYNRNLTSRKYALFGMTCSSIFSCPCIVAGTITLAKRGISGVTVANFSPREGEILALTLNLIPQSLGFVSTPIWASLIICSGLESERASSDCFCLAIFWSGGGAIAGLPLLILGIALLLQVMIALSGMRAVKILTWSSSPFDLTAALVHHMQLTPLLCGPCVVPDLDTIRKFVIFLWVTVAACTGWAALVMYIGDKFVKMKTLSNNPLTPHTWSFLPNDALSTFISYDMPGVNDTRVWILLFVNIVVIQGPLTLGLHFSELIANVIRDERQWRCATGRKGLRAATNPLKTIFTHPICLVLFIAKPFLPLFIFACFFTFVALRRPRGSQPAAYGHVQTLANLVDEWSPVMWWGHKEDGIPYCHAGTSEHPLPDVKMDCVYAGSGDGFLVPLS
ncbi:uncharacterized protein BJ212DRAFT_1487507 [Suillus subaureus]|uniref:Uncharacterized protein n=1 Tax=Suillus subaureus TaxID=48587 RepID=A0A9P7DSM8_9AGAM|nr:uncharacterized protein BJ212DRAFT_1487507 [Suillus subaureus]KAG1801951.1 hypothetical protein BJ212DRAFT_1487507 [Suillus subaureus]